MFNKTLQSKAHLFFNISVCIVDIIVFFFFHKNPTYGAQGLTLGSISNLSRYWLVRHWRLKENSLEAKKFWFILDVAPICIFKPQKSGSSYAQSM